AMENYRERFVTGALASGVAPDIAQEIWRQMESFAGYAFCKAHSASFALVSYQTAWLKAHYPAEFMAAVLSNQGGFYDTCAYVEEARRLGLTLLPPDVNESEYRFTSCADPVTLSLSKGGRVTHTHGVVRIGLMQVKHLSGSAIESILENRRNGPYTSLDNFLSRVTIDANETEMLIRCGAMDAFAKSRPQLLWQLKLLMKSAVRIANSTCNGQRTFQEEHFYPAPLRQAQGDNLESCVTREYNSHEKLWAELECLDLTVSEHLLALYGVEVAENGLTLSETGLGACHNWPRSILPIIAARDLSQHAGRLVTLVGWMVTAKRTRTGKRELMKFMTLEDPTACFEVTLFPKIYRQFGALAYDRGPYIVRGRVERDGQSCTLTALWLNRV
ncbi:MAG: hypothetical protein OEZ51_04760, partial [Nitrospinota bacterium]|nr:hypothetical protein [Nitrospinota bacterium]